MQGMKSRLWQSGEKVMGKLVGTDAGLASLQPLSAWHKKGTHTNPLFSLGMAQTAWQRSKALPLNHIKVRLALHLKKNKEKLLPQKLHRQPARGKKQTAQHADLDKTANM